MKIKLLGELCALLILTSACHHENVTGRLAENYDSDWGVEATNLHLIDMESASSLIAVIDTGCNIVSSSVLDGYNIIEHSSNVTDQLLHGTIIISKLLELCPNSKILPIKVADSNESIKPDDLVKGVEKAIDLKANIINISLSTIDPNPKLEAVIDKAIKQNICVIAAAGNQGLDRLPYPAAYPNVISVMARDINNRDVNFNNKSSEKKSVSAPGDHILCDGTYITGTSIATVFIVAAANYIYSQIPNPSAEVMHRILTDSCKYETAFSYGIVDFTRLAKVVQK